jgi:hypothetical protein
LGTKAGLSALGALLEFLFGIPFLVAAAFTVAYISTLTFLDSGKNTPRSFLDVHGHAPVGNPRAAELFQTQRPISYINLADVELRVTPQKGFCTAQAADPSLVCM